MLNQKYKDEKILLEIEKNKLEKNAKVNNAKSKILNFIMLRNYLIEEVKSYFKVRSKSNFLTKLKWVTSNQF